MGNPFVHLDLTCDNPAAAKKFYQSVFDWKFIDFPEMQWTGIDVGEGVGGGLGGKQMPEQPTAWTAYVGVDDVKKTIAKAKKAGATIIVEYMEIGGMGALGVFVDPQGATIGVWQSVKKPEAPAAKKAAKKAGKKSAKKAAKADAPAEAAAPAKGGKKAAKKAGKKSAKKAAKADAPAEAAAPKKAAKKGGKKTAKKADAPAEAAAPPKAAKKAAKKK